MGRAIPKETMDRSSSLQIDRSDEGEKALNGVSGSIPARLANV